MTVTRLTAKIITILLFLPGFIGPVTAGLWDEPQNLRVLPKDISPEALSSTMRSFATSTGSRCSTCHVYEDEADLATYDFPADDKQKKLTARKMLRMVADINSQIKEIQGKPESELVAVTCATCHRDQTKPEMLPDVIERTYRKDGMESAMAQYRELRDEYYGGYVFDFSPKSLMMLAEKLAGAEDYAAAVELMDLNLEFNPEYARAYALKAQFQNQAGDKEAARESLLKAIELEPDNRWHKMMLQKLDASG